MAATTGTAMLAMTIGCARCHDHKFDPIPTADYHRFTSTFTTAVRSNQQIILNQAEVDALQVQFDKEHQPYLDAIKKYEETTLRKAFEIWDTSNPEKDLPPWHTMKFFDVQSEKSSVITGKRTIPFKSNRQPFLIRIPILSNSTLTCQTSRLCESRHLQIPHSRLVARLPPTAIFN